MVKENKSEKYVAFRRHIYKGKLFEIGDKLPEGMNPGYGFRPVDTDDIELSDFDNVKKESKPFIKRINIKDKYKK